MHDSVLYYVCKMKEKRKQESFIKKNLIKDTVMTILCFILLLCTNFPIAVKVIVGIILYTIFTFKFAIFIGRLAGRHDKEE